MNEELSHLTADNIDQELPTILKMSAGLFGINVKELAQTSPSDVVRVIVEELTKPVIHVIAVIVSFVILYFVFRLALAMIIKLLDYILKSGPLGLFNKILGFVFSGACFFIVDWIVVVVVQFVMNFAGIRYDGGFVYNIFNTLNPFELLLSF